MLDKLSIPGLDVAAGTLTVPLWAGGAAAGLLVLLLLLALFRGGFATVLGTLVRLAFLLLAAAAAWVFFNRWVERDRIEAQRALDHRAAELTARVLEPNSVLGCLEPGLGDAVDASCEKALFASPETVGAATALVAARWALLISASREPGNEARLDGLRRSLQADRYGFLAQVLATREGCTAAKCEGLDKLADPTRVRANLNERTFEALVARNAVVWANRAHGPTPTAAVAPGGNVNFPSSTSIPPVSIMNTEPGAAPAAAAPPAARKPAPPRAATKPAAARPPPPPASTGAAPPADPQ
ncbi:MAG TPA: hypothetical protein VEK73_10845 [Xanthobacteraceae bacterium]|nr:hypothetical protein [Xanthobacteraceae bacterium]